MGKGFFILVVVNIYLNEQKTSPNELVSKLTELKAQIEELKQENRNLKANLFYIISDMEKKIAFETKLAKFNELIIAIFRKYEDFNGISYSEAVDILVKQGYKTKEELIEEHHINQILEKEEEEGYLDDYDREYE